jgi:hypothetical protein
VANRASLLLRLVALAGAAAACSGPTLTLQSDGPRYVDGRADDRTVLPFRYYGATDVVVVPADRANGRPDYQRLPSRTRVAIDPPATPWIFPLDFLVEVAQRLGGRDDRTAVVSTVANPTPVVEGFPPGGIEDLRARALAARTAR